MPGEPDPMLKDRSSLTSKALRLQLMPRIERRTKIFYEIYKTAFQNWEGIFINPEILFETVASCYLDMYRLKFFRGVQWIDVHKKAAYTMKWIARMRPIQIHRGVRVTPASLQANAWYAVRCGLELLEIKEESANDDWWKKWMGNMVYLLHYHSAPVEFLSSEMFVLKTLDDARHPK